MARTSSEWKPSGDHITDRDFNHVTKDTLANYLLDLREEEINYDFIMNLFGEFNGKTMCKPYDLYYIPKERFRYKEQDETEKKNKKEFVTTIGCWIYNVILRDLGLTRITGYVNESVNKKMYGKIEKQLSYAIIEDRLDTETLARYEDKMQWMMPFEDIISPCHTEKMITCTKILNKKKAELLKQNKEAVDNGDIAVIEQIQNELLDFAKDYLKDDPCMDTILSGAGGKFENNFKNMYVMKGAIRDPDPNTKKPYKVVTSNYIDGISADEYSTIAGSIAGGAYSRGKKTETGGHWEKLFISAFQHIRLDPPGSDCGTDKYITVDFSDQRIDDYMYSYVIKNDGSLELIDSTTRDKYDGKTVKLRFASMCKSKTGICNMCAGELYYKIGLMNIGMAMSQVASILKNICMKAFHDSTINTTKIDPMKAFFPFDN